MKHAHTPPRQTPEGSGALPPAALEPTESLLAIISSIYGPPPHTADEDGGGSEGARPAREKRWRPGGASGAGLAAAAEASLAGALPLRPSSTGDTAASEGGEAPAVEDSEAASGGSSGADDDDGPDAARASAAGALAAAGARLEARVAVEAELSGYVTHIEALASEARPLGTAASGGATGEVGGGRGNGRGSDEAHDGDQQAPLLDAGAREALLAAAEKLLLERRGEFAALDGWGGPHRRGRVPALLQAGGIGWPAHAAVAHTDRNDPRMPRPASPTHRTRNAQV